MAVVTGLLQGHHAVAGLGAGALAVSTWLRHCRQRSLTGHERDIIAWIATGLIGAGVFVVGDTWAAAYLPLVVLTAASKANYLTVPKMAGHLAVVAAFLIAAAAAGSIGVAHSAVTLAVAALLSMSIARTRRELTGTIRELDDERAWQHAIVAAVAHDVRSPLATINGALELLRSRGSQLDNATRDKLLASSHRQSQRIDHITRDLLDTERARDGNLHLERTPVDILSLLEDAIQTVGVDAELHIAGSPVADADPARVDQIISNLLTNAHRHGEPPIVVAARRTGDTITITVSDHGPGVPAEQVPVLFDRFGPGRSQDSVGLGMWIVKLLVNEHDGTITYRSADPGACFEIVLPAARPARDDTLEPPVEVSDKHV